MNIPDTLRRQPINVDPYLPDQDMAYYQVMATITRTVTDIRLDRGINKYRGEAKYKGQIVQLLMHRDGLEMPTRNHVWILDTTSRSMLAH